MSIRRSAAVTGTYQQGCTSYSGCSFHTQYTHSTADPNKQQEQVLKIRYILVKGLYGRQPLFAVVVVVVNIRTAVSR